jgi:hypothetical protein
MKWELRAKIQTMEEGGGWKKLKGRRRRSVASAS